MENNVNINADIIVANLKIEGIALMMKYEDAKDCYESAKNIEKEVERKAINELHLINPETGKVFRNSYEFVEDKDMWERYSNRCQHIYKRDYCIDNPKDYVYSYDFLKRYNKARKDFLMLSVKFLDAMGKEREAREIEKTINTYIPDKFAERIINLNMQFIAGQKKKESV